MMRPTKRQRQAIKEHVNQQKLKKDLSNVVKAEEAMDKLALVTADKAVVPIQGKAAKRNPPSARGPVKNKNKNKTPLTKYAKGLSRYYASLVDPWAKIDAKYPEPLSYKSAPVQIIFPIAIKSDANGRAAFMLRDGISRSYSISKDDADYSTMAYNASPAGWYLADDNWVEMPEAAAIRAAFTSYRPVSMGMRFKYTAAPLNASGRVACALFPPSLTLPNLQIENVISWADLAEFEGAQTYSAFEGFTLLWRPMSMYGLADYRPTSFIFFEGYTLDQAWDIDPQELTVGYMATYMASQKVALISSGTTIAGAWTNASQSLVLIESLLEVTLPTQSPALMAIWEGLPASTVFGEIEVCINLEAISDNRDFSLSQGLLQQQNASPMEAPSALAQLPQDHSHSNSVDHKEWAMNAAQTASNTVKSVGSGLTKAAGIAMDVVDVIGTIAAFL